MTNPTLTIAIIAVPAICYAVAAIAAICVCKFLKPSQQKETNQ